MSCACRAAGAAADETTARRVESHQSAADRQKWRCNWPRAIAAERPASVCTGGRIAPRPLMRHSSARSLPLLFAASDAHSLAGSLAASAPSRAAPRSLASHPQRQSLPPVLIVIEPRSYRWLCVRRHRRGRLWPRRRAIIITIMSRSFDWLVRSSLAPSRAAVVRIELWPAQASAVAALPS